MNASNRLLQTLELGLIQTNDTVSRKLMVCADSAFSFMEINRHYRGIFVMQECVKIVKLYPRSFKNIYRTCVTTYSN